VALVGGLGLLWLVVGVCWVMISGCVEDRIVVPFTPFEVLNAIPGNIALGIRAAVAVLPGMGLLGLAQWLGNGAKS